MSRLASKHSHTRNLVLLALLLSGCTLLHRDALAQSKDKNDDDKALDFLASQMPSKEIEPPTSKASRWYTELGLGYQNNQYLPDRALERLAIDGQFETKLASSWSLRGSQHIDWQNTNAGLHYRQKELQLSWRASNEWIWDLGRINLKNGVAYAYNPSDFFRSHTNQITSSFDPADIRENRLGILMLRSQLLAEDGSFNLVVSPRIDRPTVFGEELANSHQHARYLLSYSPKTSNDGQALSAQFLAFHEANRGNRLAMNLNAALGQHIIAYFEYAGGVQTSQWQEFVKHSPQLSLLCPRCGFLDPNLNASTKSQWRNQIAGGMTYTTANNLSLTAEWHFDGSAPNKDDRQTIKAILQNDAQQARSLASIVYPGYRQWVAAEQNLASQQQLFLHLRWQDIQPQWDFNAMHNLDLLDHSHASYIEIRRRFKDADVAIQWAQRQGLIISNYGVRGRSQQWQILVRHYW